MNNTTQLPLSIDKKLQVIGNSIEKTAKHRFLIDLAESIVIHVTAFVLGEYKKSGIVEHELERIIENDKHNVSFGTYKKWLQNAIQVLDKNQTPSRVAHIVNEKKHLPSVILFIKAFELCKKLLESGKITVFVEEWSNMKVQLEKEWSNKKNQHPPKTTLIEFIQKLVELRNKYAHPHYEHNKTKQMVEWPITEDSYYDLFNPLLLEALKTLNDELSSVWEFREYVVDSVDNGSIILRGAYQEDDVLEMEGDIPASTLVLKGENTMLIGDWRLLKIMSPETKIFMEQDQEEKRNKATIDDIRKYISEALADGQISLTELNFISSLAKTKMQMSQEEVRSLVLEVAESMDITDPFPEVDKRFIEVVDHAITTKTYNEFLLKLTGQQYGVSSEQFEKLFNDRTFALNVDPVEVRRNKVVQMSTNDFRSYANLMRAQQWIYALGTFSRELRGIYNMTAGAADTFATKEYWQRWAFNAVEDFAKKRIETISPDPEHWQVKMNMWQQGYMTGYAWCSIFPKESPVKSVLALDLAINNSERIKGDVMIGFLPNRRDEKLLENAGLLYALFARNLKEFTEKFMEDIRQYPHLKMWDSINFCGNYPLSEITEKYPWFYTYLYALDEIQFVLPMKELVENPSVVQDTFDISFNLFNGLFEEVIQDYQNLKSSTYLIHEFETTISVKLKELFPIFDQFGLIEQQNKKEKLNDVNVATSEEVEVVEEVLNGLTGSVNHGHFSKIFRSKEQGYPLLISFSVRQDYHTNQLFYRMYISCAGYLEPTLHSPIERVLESMLDLEYPTLSIYFLRSKLVAIFPIENIETCDLRAVTYFLLNEFSARCALNYTSFQSLKVHHSVMDLYEPQTVVLLNQLMPKISALFSNGITRERNWMKGYRFLDFVSSTKGVGMHSLGWGLEFHQDQMMAGVVLHVGDSLKGAQLMEQMHNKANNDSAWKFVSKGDTTSNPPQWILSNSSALFTSSSDHKQNHKAHHALISNEKTYWCAAKQDDKQWWQVELPEAMTISQLVLKGAPHGKSYVTRFHLMYSVDKKNWQTLSDFEGLNDGFSTLELTFESAFNAKFIKIIPVEFVGWPGFRVDFWGKKIVPSKIELQHWVPVNNEQELAAAVAEFEHNIMEIKAFKGLGF